MDFNKQTVQVIGFAVLSSCGLIGTGHGVMTNNNVRNEVNISLAETQKDIGYIREMLSTNGDNFTKQIDELREYNKLFDDRLRELEKRIR